MYRIIGADQREYGPVNADQVRTWIANHRADRDTKIQIEGTGEWRRLADLPEFAEALRAGIVASAAPTQPLSPNAIPPSGGASGLAIASLVLGVLGLLSCGLTALVGLVLGIVALVRINKSAGTQRGQGMAIAGIIVSAVFLLALPIGAALVLPAMAKAKSRAQNVMCMSNLKQLALGAIMYADDHNDKLPPADRWCESVKPYVSSDAPFRCASGQPNQSCHYGYNAQLDGLELKRVTEPGRFVLFFEIEGGWNVSGGRDAVLSRPRHAQACMIAFLDGHVEAVPAARLSELRWGL